MELLKETPDNINQLVKEAGLKDNWEARLSALDELKKYDCTQSRDVILRLALHDKVYKVKEEAFRASQILGIEKNGNPIHLGRKDIGYKVKDFTKIFSRVKKDKTMDDFNLSIFKETFKILNPEMYDVMKFEKGNKFDSWIESSYSSLPKK
ncbi:MAG: HEAT repeat domain-containing protein [Helicobacteraceae bacterium]|nr:HEAT repeat domain-containing protein [Helicobacteraceae bacterium]